MTRPAPFIPPVSDLPGPVLSLQRAVRHWRDATTGWLQIDDPAGAAILAARRPPTDLPRVVVVGEANRGKSSLINALLGLPGLSPVDAGLATCTYLVFTHSSEPYAVARFAGGMAAIEFPPDDLRAWATINGEPDVEIPPPRWIEVGVAATLAASMTLVDTPGVGGLVAAHAELAVEAASAATALLFVLDASAPFSRAELDFLTAVSERVEAVHFVVTKTDAYRGWREIVAADQVLLASHAPRFADAQFHPVSSRLAETAAVQEDPKIVDMLSAQSGVAALRGVLANQVTAAAARTSDANIIRTTITVLSGAIVRLEGQRLALTAGAARAGALKVRRAELIARRKAGTRGWQVMLRAEIQRARVDLTHETAREVREAAQMFRGSIDHADTEELKNMAFHIDAYAQAMTIRAHSRLTEAMAKICRSALANLFSPSEMTALVSALATRPYAALVTRRPDKARSLDDTIMTMSGAGMGFSLSRLATMLPAAALPAAFGVVLAPVSVVIGGAAALYLVKSRRRLATKAHLKQWLGEVLGEVKAQIDQNIAEQFIEADEQLTLALDDALTRQVTAMDNQITDVDGALKLDAAERAERLRTLDERHAVGAQLTVDGENLLLRLRFDNGRTLAPAGIASSAADLAGSSGTPPAQAGVPGAAGRPRTMEIPAALLRLVAEQRAAAANAPPAARGRHAAETEPEDSIVLPTAHAYSGLDLSALWAVVNTGRQSDGSFDEGAPSG